MSFPHAETIAVRRAPLVIDSYGNEIRGEVADAGTVTAGVAPIPAEELTEFGRQGVTVDLQLICDDVDADIHRHDQVVVDGVAYEVVGEVQRWRSPMTGWTPGCRVLVRRVDG